MVPAETVFAPSLLTGDAAETGTLLVLPTAVPVTDDLI